jgi:enoyl-CoA hydratase/carnithine racemase
METLSYEENEKKIGILTLKGGSGNPLSPQMVHELDEILKKIMESSPQVLILHGGEGKIFSGGFSLPHIFDWNRSQINDFFTSFTKSVKNLITLPCPTISAVNGHAIAAGFILSLGTDLRIVRTGKTKLGFSEVDLGIGVPYGTQVLFSSRTSNQVALRYTMMAELFGPETAKNIGYADFLAENPLTLAIDLAHNIIKKPGFGAQNTKLFHAQKIAREFKEAEALSMENFLDSWFSPEAQQGIKGLAEKLSKK